MNSALSRTPRLGCFWLPGSDLFFFLVRKTTQCTGFKVSPEGSAVADLRVLSSPSREKV